MRRPALLALAVLMVGPAASQGVPTFDLSRFARVEALIEQTGQDLAIQRERLTTEEALAEIEREQLEALQAILEGATSLGPGDVAGTVGGLEAGPAPEAAADVVFAPADPNPGAPLLFGDAAGSVERLIIEGAKATHGLPGVSAAGLSLVQWRCLLQALIWQESRFSVGARSPADAYGLTQIIPGTAQQLGIYPDYYDDPVLQVEGGARYLAQQLGRFDGNVIHALAAYNAGPGRVIEYGGVPPFAETQHYVQVIPERYNLYLSRVGGIDALGAIDPALLANASFSLTAHGAGVYGDWSMVSVRAASARIAAIVERIGETEDVHEALALNSYARAELARLVAIRTRLLAARTKPPSAETVAMAAAVAAERRFIDQTAETLR